LARVYYGQTATWIKMASGVDAGHGPRWELDCTRWDPVPLPKKGHSPQFSAHFYCGQTAGCIKMPLGMEVGLGLGHIVLDGDPALSPLKGHSPLFSAHERCGQTAGGIKMARGMEVGLGPGDFVLDGDSAPPTKKTHSPYPIFGSFLLWPNDWMDQTATWYGGRRRRRRRFLRRGPSSPKRGTAPSYRPMPIVAKWLDG